MEGLAGETARIMANTRVPVTVFFLLVLASVLVAFQNCGQLKPSISASSAETARERAYKMDLQLVSRITTSPKLGVWFSTRESALTLSGTDVLGVMSINPAGFKLTSTVIAPLVAPKLDNSYLSFDGSSILSSISPDGVLSDGAAIVAVLQAPASGRLINLSGGGLTEAFTIEAEGNFIRARRYTDDLNFETAVQTLPSSGPFIVAAAYNRALGKLAFQVNGVKSLSGPIPQGAPIDAALVLRQLVLGDGVGGKLRVAELMVVGENLEPWEINALSRYQGERWGIQVMNDLSLYPVSDGVDIPVPPDVRQVLTNNCTGCHIGSHLNAWATYRTADFKNHITARDGVALVVPGDPQNSALYFRLKGVSDAPKGDKDMPAGLSGAIDEASRNIIKNWILSLKK